MNRPLDELRLLPVWLSMDPPGAVDVETVCVALSAHDDEWVRGNAVLGFGHLARTLGRLDEARVRPVVEAALRDPSAVVRGQAVSAADDLTHFLGWRFPAAAG